MSKEKEFKTRNWFLTINENAKCFPNTISIVKGIPKLTYACILHDKDNEEQPHYHLCLLFENARTFSAIQKHFIGAHIEVMESKFKTFRYLIHLDDREKFQYSINEIIDNENCFNYYSQHDDHIKLDEFTLFQHIENGNINNITDCVRLFGLKQTNLFRNTISKVLEEKIVKSSYILSLEFDISCLQDLNNELKDKNQDLMIENLKLDAELSKALIKIRDLRNLLKKYESEVLF